MDTFPVSSDLLGKSASAYEHLRRAIVRGQLRPGRRLSATGLAAHYRISETPVREALVRLSAEGFLTWEASKGHFTKPATLREQADLHEVIAMSLNRCLRRLQLSDAGSLGAVEQRARLELVEPLELPDAAEQTAERVAKIGAAIVERNGNAVLRLIMSNMLDRTELIRRLDLDTPERIGQVRVRIERLTSAILAADTATAMAIVGQHMAERRARLPDLVEAANALAARATYP